MQFDKRDRETTNNKQQIGRNQKKKKKEHKDSSSTSTLNTQKHKTKCITISRKRPITNNNIVSERETQESHV